MRNATSLLGHLLGHSIWEREALLALTRRWPMLPEELRLAVLRVAGIDDPNL